VRRGIVSEGSLRVRAPYSLRLRLPYGQIAQCTRSLAGPQGILNMAADRGWLYFAVFVRSLATGMIGVLLGLYLSELHLGAGAIGTIVSVGLGGAAFATLLATLYAHVAGHRRTLLLIAWASFVGALLLMFSTQPLALGVAAAIGMVNGMGRDRGAALVVEQAALPATASDRERTLVFAKYNVLQDVGHALGSLLAAMPTLLQHQGIASLDAFRASVALYALLSLMPLFAYWRLSPTIETARVTGPTRLAPQSRAILWKISSLFALDSLAGGFLTTALLSFFFHERFGVGVEAIGLLFFIARIANAGSHLAAAWLARRIGLVNTMVFTHIPSSLLLATVPFMPTFPIAAALFLLREGLVEMDVPTRQSYVMAVVRPQERAFASGVTHLVRLGGWALAPGVAGLLMAGGSLALPLLVGAGMKIVYDLALWRSFRGVRPPEEDA
jgi:MFS family permease